jgi:hypothetical protein
MYTHINAQNTHVNQLLVYLRGSALKMPVDNHYTDKLFKQIRGILNILQPHRPPRPVTGDSFTLWRRSVLPVRYELDCKYCYK